jgi:DNA-binding MarR family transcriptional regulator
MDDEGAIRLRRAITRLARQLNASATGEGLSPSQASVLALVVARGPLPIAELTELEGLNPTMLSRVVGKLDAMGLVRRMPDPADLRTASVAPTPAGRRSDQRVKARRETVVSAAMDRLNPAQEKAITAALPALEALTSELSEASRAR